jgi:hypothetical protein
MLGIQIRKKVFRYPEANANVAKQSHENNVPMTKAPIKEMMKHAAPDTMTLDNSVKLCAIPKGEQQNHLALCFKRFADITDYVDHNQYFSLLNDAKYIQYNAIAIPVTSCQCDMPADHMVCCIGSTRCRKHKPPNNDTVLL